MSFSDPSSSLWRFAGSHQHLGRQAGVDVALHLAKRLSGLRLEDATASVQKDKDMTLRGSSHSIPGGWEVQTAAKLQSAHKSVDLPCLTNRFLSEMILYHCWRR